MCQLVFRLWLCAQALPLPSSPNPPTHPFTHCSGPSGWQRFTGRERDRDRAASSLEPWLWGVGADSLGPLPGADGAAPTPLGAGTESGPTVGKKGDAAPPCLTQSLLRMHPKLRDQLVPGPPGDV